MLVLFVLLPTASTLIQYLSSLNNTAYNSANDHVIEFRNKEILAYGTSIVTIQTIHIMILHQNKVIVTSVIPP